jgi:hypothetical protein
VTAVEVRELDRAYVASGQCDKDLRALKRQIIALTDRAYPDLLSRFFTLPRSSQVEILSRAKLPETAK